MKIIIFAGHNETLVGDAAQVNKLVEDWFLEGERNLDEFDVSVTDGGEGVMISARTHSDMVGFEDTNYDLIPLMPNVLRKALIAKGLLTDEDDAA